MLHEKALSLAFAGKTTKRAAPSPDFSGHWINELNSFMDLVVAGNSVSGTYTSIVSSTGLPVTGPVIGYVSDDIIAFSVLWAGTVPSITSWVGQIVVKGGIEQLDTLWHLVVDVPDAQDPNSIWTTIHAGADNFHR